MKAKRAVEIGVEHTAALIKLNERLLSGDLYAWGHIERVPDHPNFFDILMKRYQRSIGKRENFIP
jgi:hypothetical protein